MVCRVIALSRDSTLLQKEGEARPRGMARGRAIDFQQMLGDAVRRVAESYRPKREGIYFWLRALATIAWSQVSTSAATKYVRRPHLKGRGIGTTPADFFWRFISSYRVDREHFRRAQTSITAMYSIGASHASLIDTSVAVELQQRLYKLRHRRVHPLPVNFYWQETYRRES